MSDDLPMGWVKTELGEIGEWSSGGTPSRKQPEYYGGSIPWVKTGDLNNSYIESVEEFITEDGLKNSSAKIFPSGTLLLAMYGATIGKTGVLRIEAATNQACGALIAEGFTRELIPFLRYFLIHKVDEFKSIGQGGAQPNISQTIIKQFAVSLPPLNEQRRIVDKLDRIGDRNRTARNELSHIPKLIARYKQAVLAAAFRGDLTADWREKHGKMRTQWQNVSLDNLISCYQNGLSKRSGNDGQEIIVVRLADIKDFKVCLSDPRKIKLTEKEEEKYNLQAGDILVVRVNGSKDIVGRLVLITQDLKAAYCDHFIRLRLTSECNPYWLSYYGNSDEFRKYISENMVSSAGQNTVSQGTLKDYLVEIPSLEEQKEIVRRVEKMFEKIDRMEQEYQKAAKLCDRLEQATLAKAFRGELVPQDPNDEPASVLLEQVKREKEKGKKVRM
ncbi:MAG: restriction endonuclease subunit S [Pseudanabaena sp. Salubria-1]|nr:restriction endonuclease subunit S [Pseudanabaena sp. Salubria-1]